jgi:hypothetical protein
MNARTVNCALEGLQLSGGELARGQSQRLLGQGVDPGAGDNTGGKVDGQPREGGGLEPGGGGEEEEEDEEEEEMCEVGRWGEGEGHGTSSCLWRSCLEEEVRGKGRGGGRDI